MTSARRGTRAADGIAERQGRLWGAAVRGWSELNEPHCGPLYESVFDAIGVRTDVALLDAGCGAGLALQLAAKRGATVSGLDASEALLDVARGRNPGSDIRQGDEALPFEDDTFDAVTAFNSVQYAADPGAAARELRRLATPGAPVAVLAWGRAEQCETSVILAARRSAHAAAASPRTLRARGTGPPGITAHRSRSARGRRR